VVGQVVGYRVLEVLGEVVEGVVISLRMISLLRFEEKNEDKTSISSP